MYLLLLALLGDPHPPLLRNEIFVPADYPKKLDSTVEGRVRFTLEVGPDGRTKNCKIDSSSGSSRLDETTCRLAIRRARFDPARDADGKPTHGIWTSSIRWSAASTPQPGNWTVTFQTVDDSTTCWASKESMKRKVRADVCERMVTSFLNSRAQLPDHVFSNFEPEMLEPVAP